MSEFIEPNDEMVVIQTTLCQRIYGTPKISKHNLRNDVETWLNNSYSFAEEYNDIMSNPYVESFDTPYKFIIVVKDAQVKVTCDCLRVGHFVAVQHMENIGRIHGEVLALMVNGNYGGLMDNLGLR